MHKQDSAAWELNDLLAKDGIDPKTVLVLRHRPTERQFRKVLPWLAAERPDTYNAYQQTHGPKVEHGCRRPHMSPHSLATRRGRRYLSVSTSAANGIH